MMSKRNLPAILWYPGDWRKDPGVQSLTYAERGLWHEILMVMAESESYGKLVLNGRAMTDSECAVVFGLKEAKFKQTIEQILCKGVASREANTGSIICRRMVREEELRRIRAVAGSIGGKHSQENRKAKRKQNSTSSVSVSMSTSNTDKKTTPPSEASGRKKQTLESNPVYYLTELYCENGGLDVLNRTLAPMKQLLGSGIATQKEIEVAILSGMARGLKFWEFTESIKKSRGGLNGPNRVRGALIHEPGAFDAIEAAGRIEL